MQRKKSSVYYSILVLCAFVSTLAFFLREAFGVRRLVAALTAKPSINTTQGLMSVNTAFQMVKACSAMHESGDKSPHSKRFAQGLLFVIMLWSASLLEAEPSVLVTVPVYREFIHRIAGSKIIVDLMVPVGASAHTYEPTPKQVLKASKADIWFTTGEAFESRAFRALQANHPGLEQVDLRRGVRLLQSNCCCQEHCHSGYDPHVWLSPRLASQQVDIIVDALKRRYPNEGSLFAVNGEKLKTDLKALDDELHSLLGDGSMKRLVLVSHPAYGYMLPEYGIEQLSIEVEGKDPTPRQLTDLIVRAKNSGIKVVFTEPQYSNKGAKLIAQQLGVKTIELDPYSEDYFGMMRSTGRMFSEAPEIK